MVNANTRDELEARLVTRAWNDPAFRQQLLDDPRTALEQELGVELPAQMTIQILEETPDTLYMVLPESPEALSTRELSDTELDAASGGWKPPPPKQTPLPTPR